MKNLVEPEKFLTVFCEQFEEPARVGVSLNSAFKEIKGWSSLQALVITVAIHEVWGISFSDDDFRRSKTISDLLEITKAKASS